MTASPVERRLRSFCRALAVLMSIGAVIELWLVDHTGTFLQLLPFGLCVLVAGSVGFVSFRMTPRITHHRPILGTIHAPCTQKTKCGVKYVIPACSKRKPICTVCGFPLRLSPRRRGNVRE